MLFIINIIGIASAVPQIPVFADITMEAIPGERPYGSFLSIRDYDQDFLEDILIDNRLYRNISYYGFFFYEVTEEAGLGDAKGHGTFLDLNDDGCYDILFYGQKYEIQIYRNNCNGTFRKVENFAGLENCRHTEAIGYIPHRDYRYGLIYCATYEYEGEYFKDYLYASGGDFSFYDVSYLLRSDLVQEKMPSRCSVAGDLNNDSLIDLYVCNYRLYPNLLLLQDKSGVFINEAFTLNAASFSASEDRFSGSHTISASFADLNNDGLTDIVLSNLAHNDYERGDYNKKSELLLYNRDRKIYQDKRVESGIRADNVGTVINGVYRNELFSSSAIADFNNDSVQDIFFTQVYENSYSYSKFFTGISSSPYYGETTFLSGILVYDSLGAVYADLNRDGCPDIITAGRHRGEKNRSIHIFENLCSYPGDFIQFRLSGKSSGSVPVGSRVRIFLKNREGAQVLTREVESAGLGFGQQNTGILHFGLGTDYEIEHIEVEWVSGIFQILYGYEINSLNYVSEPDNPFDCKAELIEYDEKNYYFSGECRAKDGYYAFYGNSCEKIRREIDDVLLDKSLFRKEEFCKDYILILNESGFGRKIFF